MEESEPFGVNEDEHAQVRADVEQMLVEHVLKTTQHFLAAAADTERAVAEHAIDLDDPPYWRAVIAELRRRAAAL